MTTDHVKMNPQWRKLFLRAQSTTRNHDGIAVIQLIAVCKDGIPLYWFDPKIVKFEPKLEVSVNELKDTLGEEQLAHLLEYIVKNA